MIRENIKRLIGSVIKDIIPVPDTPTNIIERIAADNSERIAADGSERVAP